MFTVFQRFTPISRAAAAVSLLLVGALSACGGDDTVPNGGGNWAPLPSSDPEYFGLQDGLCYRYDVGNGNLWFTLEIREDDGIAVRDTTTWEMTWRDNAGEWRTDWVEVTTNGELRLHQRRMPGGFGSGPVYDIYDPAPVLLRKDMTPNVSIQTSTTSRRVVGSSRSEVESIIFHTVGQGMEEVDVLGKEEEVQLLRFTVADPELPGYDDKARFLPNQGFVSFETDSSSFGDMPLGAVDVLEEGEECMVE